MDASIFDFPYLGSDWKIEYNRRAKRWEEMPGVGGRPGSKHALRITHRTMLECQDCGGLVAKYWATRQAKKAGRKHYALGDGCASRKCCVGIHRPTRYRQCQERMQAELSAGSRRLIAWPNIVPSAR
jgi:hypothetical protein